MAHLCSFFALYLAPCPYPICFLDLSLSLIINIAVLSEFMYLRPNTFLALKYVPTFCNTYISSEGKEFRERARRF